MHTPVLLKQVLEGLQIKEGGRYIDATLGQGGHTQAILELGGSVLAIDQDKSQIQNLTRQLADKAQNEKLRIAHGNFRDIERIAKENEFVPVDGILFDLGLSMRQLAESGKGLSYKNLDEPLDMRVDDNLETSAQDIITNFSDDQLYEIFARNAEEIHSRQFARDIVRARPMKKDWTVGDLVSVIRDSVNNCTMKDNHQTDKILARVFQALRIEVNHEFQNLRQALEGATKILNEEGRVAVITFHSLEDRIVKQFIREKQLKEEKLIKGTVRFERSAKLRIFSYEKNN